MKVTVNNIEVTVHQGATVADALRRYLMQIEGKCCGALPEVRDQYGNIVAHDGALTEHTTLVLVKCCNDK